MIEFAESRFMHMNTTRAETAVRSCQYMNLPAPVRRLKQGDYMVVEMERNELRFISNSQVVFKAACLTGTGKEFIDPVDGRKWFFDTPRGEFYITSKVQDLVWRPPDRSFTQKGRFENGGVEDHSLGFGNGYSIHGMLDAKSVGKIVIRGCIRLDDPDLRALFKRTHVGTPLLIF